MCEKRVGSYNQRLFFPDTETEKKDPFCVYYLFQLIFLFVYLFTIVI